MAEDLRTRLRAALDASLGRAATLVVSLPVYALAAAAAILRLRLMPGVAPMLAMLAAIVAATLVVFAASALFGNASLYDPFWSVAPPLLFLHLMLAPGSADSWRTAIAFALLLAWAVRLTWNRFGRWPHLAEEDFRYRDLRRQSGALFPLVSLGGIHLFPTLMIFLGCLPFFAVATSGAPLGLLDLAATLVMGGAIALEAVADRELAAHRRADPGGVLTSGVWGWSQHPNYLGEMGVWWGVLLFGLAAGAPLWTAIGAVAMTALFWFVSIPLMLARKRRRRPGYDAAVAGIPVLVPGLRGGNGRR